MKNKEEIENQELDQELNKEENNETEKTSYKDLYLRVTADFQNYKRRVNQERAQWMIDAQMNLLEPLLSVIDDLDRAIESCAKQEETKEQQSILKGLELVKKNVEKTFKDLKVEEIDCSGQFDPDFHEALLQVDSKEYKSGAIVDVISKGYTFYSQVVRHAKVSVAK